MTWANRLDPVDDDAPWVSTPNVTLEIRGLEDGPHVLTVRARETEAEGGSSDQVSDKIEFVASCVLIRVMIRCWYLRLVWSAELEPIVSRFRFGGAAP